VRGYSPSPVLANRRNDLKHDHRFRVRSPELRLPICGPRSWRTNPNVANGVWEMKPPCQNVVLLARAITAVEKCMQAALCGRASAYHFGTHFLHPRNAIRKPSGDTDARLVKKPVERPASVFDVEIIGPLLSKSTITRARNGRPEYNLAQDA
jgi:hypothetical protein